jgi:hypothetical protein
MERGYQTKTDFLTAELFKRNLEEQKAENKNIEQLKLIYKNQLEERQNKLSKIGHIFTSGSAPGWAHSVNDLNGCTQKLELRIKFLETILQLFIESL